MKCAACNLADRLQCRRVHTRMLCICKQDSPPMHLHATFTSLCCGCLLPGLCILFPHLPALIVLLLPDGNRSLQLIDGPVACLHSQMPVHEQTCCSSCAAKDFACQAGMTACITSRAAFLCADDTAMMTLGSPMATRPVRCASAIFLMSQRSCALLQITCHTAACVMPHLRGLIHGCSCSASPSSPSLPWAHRPRTSAAAPSCR